MQFIKFTEGRTTVEAEPQAFKAGRVYQLREDSCERWKKRGVAIDATKDEFDAQAKADAAGGAKKDSGGKPEKKGKADTSKAASAVQTSASTAAPQDTSASAEAGTAAGEGEASSASPSSAEGTDGTAVDAPKE